LVYEIASDQTLPSDTGKMLCGHHRTSLRLLVEHQILKEYIEQQRKPI